MVFPERRNQTPIGMRETPDRLRIWAALPTVWIHLAVLAFMGGLFVVKYAPRISLPPYLAASAYLVCLGLQFAAVAGLTAWPARLRRRRFLPFLFAAVFLAAALPVYARMDPLALRVDRWSALDYFLQALLRGDFPYQARTHLDHVISGFPGLFAMALPFYGLGDVGLLPFAGLLGFALLAARLFPDGGVSGLVLGLLIGMPPFVWEVFVRSDLFANMVAAAWLVHLGAKPVGAAGGKALLWGAAWGLMLSTRGVVIIPLLFSAFRLLEGAVWKSRLMFAGALGAAWLATFAPFYLWDPRLFLRHNPFHVQSGYIPGWALAVVVAASIFLGYRNRGDARPFFRIAFPVFATVAGCFLLKCAGSGWSEAVWDNGFDISYFSLALPFLLLSLGETLAGAEGHGRTGPRPAAAAPPR